MADPSDFVRVQFFGICTHMAPQPRATEPAHWGHRVVVVNASDRTRWQHVPELSNVVEHHARLQIGRQDLTAPPVQTPWFPITAENSDYVEWKLDGVTIQLANAVSDPSAIRAGECIPHLGKHCEALPVAGPATFASNPDWTACYFDFPDAHFEGKSINQGAAVGLLTVKTPIEPLLQITSFTDGQTIAFGINHGAHITISNIPEDSSGDESADFYLHFLTASEFPAGMSVPEADSPKCPDLQTYNLPRKLGTYTGPGCSNSIYP
jgi:hypothetical protein